MFFYLWMLAFKSSISRLYKSYNHRCYLHKEQGTEGGVDLQNRINSYEWMERWAGTRESHEEGKKK